MSYAFSAINIDNNVHAVLNCDGVLSFLILPVLLSTIMILLTRSYELMFLNWLIASFFCSSVKSSHHHSVSAILSAETSCIAVIRAYIYATLDRVFLSEIDLRSRTGIWNQAFP